MNGGENVGVSERGFERANRTRGTLRVYLGAAPGVGKTFAMLNEGRRASSAAPTWSSGSPRRMDGSTPPSSWPAWR